jgi:uncharacterized protein
MNSTTFAPRYGPWALVAGASDGLGSAFAEALAERGLNIVLLARRKAVLDQVAAGIRERTGAQTRTLAIDLARPGATAEIMAGVRDVEVGFLVYCAGADPEYRPFLDQPVEAAHAMLRRNCAVPMELCHHLAGPMVARGRGGIVIFGSGAGFAGAQNMAAYGASKAFDMVFAEALWTEVAPQGVDVLGLILADTDTPSLRRLRYERGLAAGPDEPARGATPVRQVVDEALAHLTKGPTHLVSWKSRAASRLTGLLSRNIAVRLFNWASGQVMGTQETARRP